MKRRGKRTRDVDSELGGRNERESRESGHGALGYWLGIVGSVLAVAAAAGSVVHWYESKVFELKAAELQRDYAEKEAQLKRDYDTKARAIEFGLGGKDHYVDVADFLLPPAKVMSLPPNVTRFDLTQDIAFFVADYPGEDWQFIPTNELKLTEMMVGKTQALKEARDMGLENTLRESQIFLFRHPANYTMEMRGRIRDSDAAPYVTFFPVIAVQPIEHKFVSDSIGAPPEARQDVADLLAAREKMTDPLRKYTVEQRLASALDDMYRADFAGQVLRGLLDSGYKYVSDYSGVEYRLLTVQKQANVVFLQSSLRFRNVSLRGRQTPVNVEVSEIIMFVTGADRSFLVRAVVPSAGGSGTAQHEWVRRWLTGFKVIWS